MSDNHLLTHLPTIFSFLPFDLLTFGDLTFSIVGDRSMHHDCILVFFINASAVSHGAVAAIFSLLRRVGP